MYCTQAGISVHAHIRTFNYMYIRNYVSAYDKNQKVV